MVRSVEKPNNLIGNRTREIARQILYWHNRLSLLTRIQLTHLKYAAIILFVPSNRFFRSRQIVLRLNEMQTTLSNIIYRNDVKVDLNYTR